ncbi:multidrug efflux RND transporter permease subunit [Bordetella holmesii]|uniref:Multidrug resistance protein MdtC n=3 Tax=Bordetella holmesii TaxID=35814 RepID=A0A158M834_9BORD|nr:multidrug efflux RND transporter permease subunit [Bordetella holmesii]AIT26582.1 multidrug resistance protein MdtC [Bordetella holmesii 44057]EWM51324.1 multidrug resistance protein MdtC [Bordetella holmesii 70147]AMD45571.1 multidrug transporter [Bordetella holmesii H558]AOB34457.1 multidrug transporter subunit MdtC [Bordetella holmesii]AUL18472.1 multidrug transporter subunit MdtC [Bordetella holmesii]
MILSAPFIVRPVATTLLALAVVLAGTLAFRLLPVAPLPQVDIPTISVSASLPGASPETMASSVATPLERSLGSIAGVTEMTSRSTQGSTRITLQFDLDRNIDGAARDVQAAINAARSLLPTSLRSNPTYHKANPSAAPIMTLAMTSKTLSQGQLYDLASTIVAQKLAQVNGVGEVTVGGSSLPAVRVSLNPGALANRGVSLDQVRQTLSNANALRPKGVLENDEYHWQILASDQLNRAEQYRPLIVAWVNGAAVRLSDVATVEDSVEDLFQTGFYNDGQAILLILRWQADANIIETVDAVRAQLPQLAALLPGDVDLLVAQDRTPSIRASLHEAEATLVIAVGLVVLVVLLFLRRWRAAIIPSVAVPVSLVGTFCIMYLCGYTLNTISLMALIVATGFVVDDAIVVLENIMRHVELGASPMRAALRGSREVGFTVLSMSLSLVAVFIPILLMGGVVGRLFREFAVTLSAAILVSLVVSLTLTPMMCARLLRAESPEAKKPVGRAGAAIGRFFDGLHDGYARSLQWALNHGRLMIAILLGTIALNVYLYTVIPKGFLPQQDTGQLLGFFRVDQGTSFQATVPKLEYFRKIITADPAVQSLTAYAGGRGGSNTSFMQIQLKPQSERGVSSEEVINRLRGRLQREPGAQVFLVSQQDIRIGGRQSTGSYDYTLMSGDLALLRTWMPKVQRAMAELPELTDVDADVEDKGRQINLVIDRESATRLGINMATIAAVLNNSYSQRQVSVMYGPLNQYHVVMGVDQKFAEDAESLKQLTVVAADGSRVPLAAFARLEVGNAPLSVSHQGLFVADTISFGTAPGVSLEQATRAIDAAVARIGLPSDQIQAGFQGTAAELQKTLARQPWLILAALVAMYIVLGVLYESYIHPITILSTLPSAGIGALLALMALNTEFTLIALIGVFLLIGIVKKNAIMMVDFALAAQRQQAMTPRDAIYQACLTRFRPIMMTTLAAIFGALPLVLATGAGVEMRRPLGITIVGGLVLSQVLTLYTTPVVYLYLDRFRIWANRQRAARPEPEHS